MQSFVSNWGTSQFSNSDQYDAWTGALNETFGRWTVKRPEKPSFFGSVRSYDDTILKVIDCRCDPCSATRGRADIAADGRETVTIQLVLHGQEYIDFDNEEITLRAGDLLIWDSTKPMSFWVQDPLHKVSVVLPLERFRSWLPKSWFKIQHYIDGQSISGRLLANHIQALSTSVFNGGCKDDYALIDATIGLLVNALNIDCSSGPKPLRITQLYHTKQYMMANLKDPALSPKMIAEAGRMSPRYLHWLFEPTNETVKQFIFNNRLDLCARDLMNLHMRHRKLADIAQSWGFTDATHFSKRFKQQYGVSPRTYRDQMSTMQLSRHRGKNSD